ncbi:unnamed protein product [Gadus morhua 'NCC']
MRSRLGPRGSRVAAPIRASCSIDHTPHTPQLLSPVRHTGVIYFLFTLADTTTTMTSSDPTCSLNLDPLTPAQSRDQLNLLYEHTWDSTLQPVG